MAVKMSKAEVTGRGDFPFDMLRYDQCYPLGPGDSGALYARREDEYPSMKTRTVVVAQMHASEVPPRWTPERWRSFGWGFTEVE